MEKKRILIYDDDVEILNVCKVILEFENYHVVTLGNCENIIADIEQINPHIILMDLWIPTIGGETAIQMMQENEETKHIPVLLFSANAEIEKVNDRIHATGFLKKPFDIQSFRKKIEEHIL